MSQSPAGMRRGLILPLAFTLVSFAASMIAPAEAAAQGLTYSVSPSARWIEWDEDLAFKQSRLLGGSLGIGFGRYVGLQANYHKKDGLRLFESVEGEEAPRLFDLAQSGAHVSLALGSGTFVPVLVGGGSLLSFEPADGDKLKKLSLDYGAGFRVVLAESLHGEVLVESTQYRLDPGFLSTGEASFEGTGPLRRNTTLTANLGLQLGRRSFDRASELDDAFAQRYQAPFSNFALAIEPAIGRLDYDKALQLENQEMVGIRAGVDFGSFFGIRGFHWWGTESDFRSTTDMRAWGGEAQFTLAGGPGLNPYLVGGAGELTWGEAAEGEPALPEDQTALIVGGGVDFNLGPRVRVTVAARDFILSGSDLTASPDLSTISDPDELVHNWQFSAGLKFLLGRSGIRSGSRAEPRPEESPAPMTREPEQEAPRAAEPVAVAPAPVQATPVQPTQPVAPQPEPAVVMQADTVGAKALPGQTIVLPVLEQGEIYIRFGAPGSSPLVTTLRPQGQAADTTAEPTGITLDDLRRLIQEELTTQPERPATDPESLQELEARLMRRLNEIEAAARRTEAAAAVTPTPVVVPGTTDPSAPMARRVEELRPYTGFNMTNDVQILVGLGVDVGPLRPGSRLNLVPQAALGFGGGQTSFLVSADVEYRLPEVDAGTRVTFEPLLSLGPGLIKRRKMELQLGMFLGSGVRIYREDGPLKLHLFGGIQGVDFFDDTRIIVGMRRTR